MSRPRRLTLLLVLLCLALLWAGFVNLGPWLIIGDPLPPKVDVIFTFGGEVARDNYSEQLATAHPEATWIVSTYRTAKRSRFLDGDVDSARVSFVDTCHSTWSEVHYLRGWLAQRRAKARAFTTGSTEHTESGSTQRLNASTTQHPLTIALVSGPYHMRRIKVAITRLVGPGRDIRIVYAPVPHEWYPWSAADYRRWWVRRDLRAVVLSEVGKSLFYLARM